jgi:hypothetical protein
VWSLLRQGRKAQNFCGRSCALATKPQTSEFAPAPWPQSPQTIELAFAALAAKPPKTKVALAALAAKPKTAEFAPAPETQGLKRLFFFLFSEQILACFPGIALFCQANQPTDVFCDTLHVEIMADFSPIYNKNFSHFLPENVGVYRRSRMRGFQHTHTHTHTHTHII